MCQDVAITPENVSYMWLFRSERRRTVRNRVTFLVSCASSAIEKRSRVYSALRGTQLTNVPNSLYELHGWKHPKGTAKNTTCLCCAWERARSRGNLHNRSGKRCRIFFVRRVKRERVMKAGLRVCVRACVCVYSR